MSSNPREGHLGSPGILHQVRNQLPVQPVLLPFCLGFRAEPISPRHSGS